MTAKNHLTIGVIADTHNRYLPRVAEIFHGVDEIWHLGDVCEESILDELRLINPRVTVVLGNNDVSLDYPLTRDLTRRGVHFHLVHIPPKHKPEGCDWLLYGHTHRPVNTVEAGVQIFNPGSAGRANKGAPLSVGILNSVTEGKFQGQIVLI